MRTAALAAFLALVLATDAAAQTPGCFGALQASQVTAKPGPPMRFGVTPGVQTGQLGTGPIPPRTPEDPEQQVAALERLRVPGRHLVLRLHRFFWSDGEAGIQRFLALARRYTARGFLVELQLRYHPTPEQEGDIGAWTAYVRDVVRRFGANPRVVAVQVTNEVNLPISPDSSDGAYAGAREALVRGVIAAHEAARGTSIEVGFNWAYRLDPVSDTSFWNALRDRGGAAFVRAVDWVGLDAYPGTFFPPVHTPGGERDGVVNALDALRCFMAIPGIPADVPIHVEENGWPTAPLRPEAYQAKAAETMIRAFHDYRGTYNVSDYRWFNLRDGDSTSPNQGVRYGLLRDDYSEKPVFGLYRRLIEQLAATVPEPRVRAGCRRVRVTGEGIARVRVGRRRDATPPFAVRLPRRHGRRVRVRVRMLDGRDLRLRTSLPARCASA